MRVGLELGSTPVGVGVAGKVNSRVAGKADQDIMFARILQHMTAGHQLGDGVRFGARPSQGGCTGGCLTAPR